MMGILPSYDDGFPTDMKYRSTESRMQPDSAEVGFVSITSNCDIEADRLLGTGRIPVSLAYGVSDERTSSGNILVGVMSNENNL